MKKSIISFCAIIFISLSSISTGQNAAIKDSIREPIKITVTKETLKRQVDSIKAPYEKVAQNYQIKMDNKDREIQDKIEFLRELRTQKKNKVTYVTKKIIVRDSIPDTIFIEVPQRTNWIKRQFNKLKQKNKQ